MLCELYLFICDFTENKFFLTEKVYSGELNLIEVQEGRKPLRRLLMSYIRV